MNNWPDPNETEKLLSLTGLSGADRQLVDWYLHGDYDAAKYRNPDFEEDYAYKRIRLNSLLQSRFFELQEQQKCTTSNPR
jgi:hypothetical protein